MPKGRAPLIASLVLAIAAVVVPAQAQSPPLLSHAIPLRFEAWRAAVSLEPSLNPTAVPFAGPSKNRARHALIGGVIGAVAGVAFCTAVATLVNDSAEGGLSACPLDTYLIMGSAGFALGFAIGWAI